MSMNDMNILSIMSFVFNIWIYSYCLCNPLFWIYTHSLATG